MSRENTLVIGIGSPHGDDQAGWQVVENLSQRREQNLTTLKLASPLEMLDHLDRAGRILLVDAACGLDEPIRVFHHPEFAKPENYQSLSVGGTHDLSLPDAIALAERLGHRLDHVELWMVPGESFAPLTAMSERTQRAVDLCTQLIVKEVQHARNVVG